MMPYAIGLTLNPILNRSNIHVVGDYDTNTCSLVISDFSVMNEGTYRCQYIKNKTTNTHVFKVQMICKYQYFHEQITEKNVHYQRPTPPEFKIPVCISHLMHVKQNAYFTPMMTKDLLIQPYITLILSIDILFNQIKCTCPL